MADDEARIENVHRVGIAGNPGQPRQSEHKDKIVYTTEQNRKIKSVINVPLSSSLNSRDGGRHIGMMLDTLNFLSWSTVMPIKLSI